MNRSFDFLIAGSGFGGSLMGLILRRMGFSVAIIDRSSHPRFAIGESSTPLADRMLAELCQRYALPEIAPLTSYGCAKRELPHIKIGLKRGFSYFRQRVGQEFHSRGGRGERLLVAASNSDDTSDTHWLRSDVDQFFAQQAQQAGVQIFEQTRIANVELDRQVWQLTVIEAGVETQQLSARFLIDASGPGAAIAERAHQLDRLPSQDSAAPATDEHLFLTNSRALFGHFRGVTPWQQVLVEQGVSTEGYPFPCDHAALHHIIDGGWIWNLRFDHGITSVGIVLDCVSHREIAHLPAADQFRHIVRQYPSVERQMRQSRCVAPLGGIQSTPRMQFLRPRMGGRTWVCLPSAAGFVDPLHSTGIAHTLHAISQLSHIFQQTGIGTTEQVTRLDEYTSGLRQEFVLIDQLVSAAYRANGDFDALVSATMLYFTAVTFSERNSSPQPSLFLNAGNQQLTQCVQNCWAAIEVCRNAQADWTQLPARVRQCIAPFNLAGLADDTVDNLYSHTYSPG